MCHQRLTFSFGPQINFVIGISPSLSLSLFPVITKFYISKVTMEVCVSLIDHSCSTLTSLSGGKSAVLSAITIALGGKTISTGRGNGLKAFIREGQRSYIYSIRCTWLTKLILQCR